VVASDPARVFGGFPPIFHRIGTGLWHDCLEATVRCLESVEERKCLMTKPHVLVSTEWLAAHLDDPAYAVVEVDEDTSAYLSGHIPGAVALDWRAELHDLPRRDFVSSERLAELLGAKGVSSEQTIVLYGGNRNWFATYAYWLAMLRGVKRIKLLDGGRMKWELEDRPLTSQATNRSRALFTMGEPRPDLRIHRDELISREVGGRTLVDVRSPEEFRGELLAPPHLPQEQPYVPGHIPGARNIPWSQTTREDGTFKTPKEIESIYRDAGVSANGEIVTYCRIGERSSHTWFALSELLGFPSVRNYDGSWTEYGSLVGVDVERG
jgi:thiosulfate/3-mercaptopyruvate sulfurtransferase